MNKSVVWNSFLAALMTAAFAILGWLSLSVIRLQNQYAAEAAEKQLRQEITDVLNDVDKRLAVIEAVMVMRRVEIPTTQEMEPMGPIEPPSLEPPDQGKPPEADDVQMPRYDLRDQSFKP